MYVYAAIGELKREAPVAADVINRPPSLPPDPQKQMNANFGKNATKPKVFRAADYEHVQLLIYT